MLNTISYISVTILSICGDCKATDRVSLQICEHETGANVKVPQLREGGSHRNGNKRREKVGRH